MAGSVSAYRHGDRLPGAPGAGPDGGKLTIATDKATYSASRPGADGQPGELLAVKLKSMEGVFVRLYHLSPNKELTQIFPNAGRTDNFVKGGETVTLPGPGDHFKFRIKAADKDGRPSLGTGIILAVASPVQFTDTENLRFAQGEVFKSFAETDLRKSLLRGVKGLEVEVTNAAGRIVGNRSAPTFSARVVFTVSEK